MKPVLLMSFLVLVGCAQLPFLQGASENVRAEDTAVTTEAPPEDATTVDEFDTTTEAEREAALAAPQASGERDLGVTVATLGNPSDPGIWMETPLVEAVVQGRVEAATGASLGLELRPIEGPDTAGSRISLPALRLLELGLAGLHELRVFAP